MLLMQFSLQRENMGSQSFHCRIMVVIWFCRFKLFKLMKTESVIITDRRISEVRLKIT